MARKSILNSLKYVLRVYEYCIFSNADSVHFTLSYPQIFLYHRVQQVSSFHSVKIQSDSNYILKNMGPRGVVPLLTSKSFLGFYDLIIVVYDMMIAKVNCKNGKLPL